MKTTEKTTDLEGTFKLDGEYLKSKDVTLKVGTRHKPKKGKAKRFIGIIDPLNPAEDESYSYISSLYAVQSSKNAYELESGGNYYRLTVTGLNTVDIKKKEKEPALVFKEEKAVL